MYFPMATYTKQESNAATVYAGRIAHKDLKCTCFWYGAAEKITAG